MGSSSLLIHMCGVAAGGAVQGFLFEKFSNFFSKNAWLFYCFSKRDVKLGV